MHNVSYIQDYLQHSAATKDERQAMYPSVGNQIHKFPYIRIFHTLEYCSAIGKKGGSFI